MAQAAESRLCGSKVTAYIMDAGKRDVCKRVVTSSEGDVNVCVVDDGGVRIVRTAAFAEILGTCSGRRGGATLRQGCDAGATGERCRSGACKSTNAEEFGG
jgi:hypothetical protein